MFIFFLVGFSSLSFILATWSGRATTSNLLVLVDRAQNYVRITSKFAAGIDPFLSVSILTWKFLYFFLNCVLHKVLRTFLLLNFWWALIGILKIVILLHLHFLITLHSDHGSLTLIYLLLLIELRRCLHTDALSLLLELGDHFFLSYHKMGRAILISLSTSRISKIVLHYDPPFSLSLNATSAWTYSHLFLSFNHEILCLLHAHLVSLKSILS